MLLFKLSDVLTRVLHIFLDLFGILFFAEGGWVDFQMSYFNLSTVLGALSCCCVAGIGIHFPLENWTSLRVMLVSVYTDLLVNGIEMKSDIGVLAGLELTENLLESSL